MADAIVYQERQLFPWRFALWLVLGANATALIVVLLPPREPLASSWWLFLVTSGCAAFWLGWIWIAYRTSPIRLHERQLALPWRPAIALEHISEARIVEGDELKQIRKALGRSATRLPAIAGIAAVPGLALVGLNLAQAAMVWRMRKNPVIRGLVAVTGAPSAIYLETDESAGPTRRWLIGTKHPDEFMAALDGATAACSAPGRR